MSRWPLMTLRYRDDMKLFRTGGQRVGILCWVAAFLLLPFVAGDDFWMTILVFSGVGAIGAIGLNLLTGYTGQVSLGHAFFIGVGAYAAAWWGAEQQWPFPLWLLAAAALGGLIGGVVGPFALRLKGNYLVVVTLGLVFIGTHIFRNWGTVTGGNTGTSVSSAKLALGPLDFAHLEILGKEFTPLQSLFFLTWILVGLTALVAKNIVRTRPGRAMQAVRDRDVAAEVIGVSLARYKIGAFVVSSAMAAMAGAIFGVSTRFVSPDTFNLLLSIEYVAMIIIGGLGTIYGSVVGALFVGALPRLVERFVESMPFLGAEFLGLGPFIRTEINGPGVIALPVFNQMLFGALIVIILVVEPRGLAALWGRLSAYFKAWPFSY